MKLQAVIIAALAIISLTACTTATLEELRNTTPRGSTFHIALASEYLALSDWEAEQYDWIDSQYFAQKGLQAAYGHNTEPEYPENWNIPEAMLPEFAMARDKLLAVLTPDITTHQPTLAARAQYAYDCWLEQQEEGWQLSEIEFCKEMFYSTIEELTTIDVKPQVRSTAYMIFFEHDKYTLTEEATNILQHILQEISQYPDTEILLHGHTDRSGSEEYNMQLSQQRAIAVKTALQQQGVADERITYFAFGETDPRIITADGVKEPANRRVEIFLQ